jgi:hypothetical protein
MTSPHLPTDPAEPHLLWRTRPLFAFARSIPPGGSWSAVTDFHPLLPAIVATLAAAHGYALLLALVLGIARLGADS